MRVQRAAAAQQTRSMKPDDKHALTVVIPRKSPSPGLMRPRLRVAGQKSRRPHVSSLWRTRQKLPKSTAGAVPPVTAAPRVIRNRPTRCRAHPPDAGGASQSYLNLGGTFDSSAEQCERRLHTARKSTFTEQRTQVGRYRDQSFAVRAYTKVCLNTLLWDSHSSYSTKS